MTVNNIFVSAVIVAAGKGTRMKSDRNKQFIEICGVPVLARTIAVFEKCDSIDEIVLVVNETDMVYCKDNIINSYGFGKVRKVVKGGSTRQESVYRGLSEVDARCGIVAVHDGARPFVREEIICDSIKAALEYGAACAAVPVKDTVKAANCEGIVEETLDRSKLWAVQTPQTFKKEILLSSHEKAIEDNFIGTDDAVLVERCGYPLKLVRGSYDNIKITTAEDIIVAEAIAKNLVQGE